MDKNLGATSTSMFTGSNLKPWALNMLIQWSIQDPVSEKEINRNNAVYQQQGNRNPFVDYPELVGKIYGADSVNVFLPSSIDEYESFNYVTFSNPSTQSIQLFYAPEFKVGASSQITLFDLLGKNILTISLENQPQNINIQALNPGVYILRIDHSKKSKVYKLIIQ